MSRETGRQGALAAAAGVLCFLGYVGFGLAPLIFVCLVPLLAAIRDTAPARQGPVGDPTEARPEPLSHAERKTAGEPTD